MNHSLVLMTCYFSSGLSVNQNFNITLMINKNNYSVPEVCLVSTCDLPQIDHHHIYQRRGTYGYERQRAHRTMTHWLVFSDNFSTLI